MKRNIYRTAGSASKRSFGHTRDQVIEAVKRSFPVKEKKVSYKPLTDDDLEKYASRPETKYRDALIEQARRANRLAEASEKLRDAVIEGKDALTYYTVYATALAAYRGNE